ncbi:MAG: GreA/GreB family elongation factor [bacterium]|nr:GreA/GreB family elongation factor [bacterium]
MEEKKYYLTKEGLDRVQKEHNDLLAFRKKKTMDDAPSILQSEDVNPEYLVYQEDLHLLEAKIAEHENILKHVELISKPAKGKRLEVCMGATVELVDESDKSVNEYTVLGTLEANPMEGKISSESPVGKQLLGKKIGEIVVINSPIEVKYRVQNIRY